MDILIKMRPKELHHKTKFIEVEMTNFYTYKKFYKDFKRSFDIDYENSLFQRKKIEMEKYSKKIFQNQIKKRQLILIKMFIKNWKEI